MLKRVGSVSGGVVPGIIDRGVTFGFSNRDAILDQNMPFFIRLYALVVKIISVFGPKGLKKPSLCSGTYLYS